MSNELDVCHWLIGERHDGICGKPSAIVQQWIEGRNHSAFKKRGLCAFHADELKQIVERRKSSGLFVGPLIFAEK